MTAATATTYRPVLPIFVGDRYGRLVVTAEAGRYRAPNGRTSFRLWQCRCDCGTEHIARGSHLRSGNTSSCGCLVTSLNGMRNRARTREVVAYGSAHDRVRRLRGAASSYACAHCDRDAAEWAYDHADDAEVTCQRRGRTVSYSLDPAHYLPLCCGCHRRFDATAAGVVTA